MKRLTLIFSLMLALVGLKANAAMYIVGDDPFGGWNPPVGVEMTGDNGVYTYNATLTTSDVFFIFAEAAGSWDVVNANRYDSGMSTDLTVTAGVEFTPVKGNTNKSFKFSGTVGETYTITFNTNTGKAMVDGYVAPITEYYYTVAGNNAEIFGAEWNPGEASNDMTLDETDGLYKLVKENVEINAGYTLLFKVVQNHSWGTNWGKTPNGENQDYYFEHAGIYNLTFKFDLANEAVWVDVELVQDGPEVNPLTGELFILGQVNGNNWNPSTGIPMATTDDNIFTLTDAVITEGNDGYGFFSFTSKLGENADDWSFTPYRRGALEDGTIVENNVPATLAGWGSTAAFKAVPGTYDITVNLSANTVLLVLKSTPEPEVDPVYIMGEVNGYAWDAIHGVQMTYDATNEVYNAEITVTPTENNTLGFFGFTKKLADAESETPWDDILPYRFGPMSSGDFIMTEELLGTECEIAEEGHESIGIPAGVWTVTVDLKNSLFKIDGTWPTDTIEPEPMVYTVVGPEGIFGSNWDETDTNNDMTLVDGVYTWTKQNVELAAGSFGFKVVGNHSWDNEWPIGYDNNWIKYVDEAGIYTITITYEPEAADSAKIACEIVKTGDIEPEHYTGDVYILGEVNDNGGWYTNVGVQMTRDEENNVYTATITTTGEAFIDPETGIGYSYFSFTKQLADSAADWDAIAPYRFGAANSEGNFWITDETLGNEIALANGGATFQIPAGEWNLTLSVDNMTLVVEKAEDILIGDANGDGVVNPTDATVLINALLNENFSAVVIPNADMDNNGTINITDAILLINYLLTL